MSVRVSKSTVNKYTQSTLKVQNELDEVLESAGVARSRPDVELKEAISRGECVYVFVWEVISCCTGLVITLSRAVLCL